MSNHMNLQVIQWMTVGEGEVGLGVVSNDQNPLSRRVFTVGGVYEPLDIDVNCAIKIGTRLTLKIHKRG